MWVVCILIICYNINSIIEIGGFYMDYGVYLESSIVDLKPRVLEFLTTIAEKAKELKEYVVSFKKKELAELAGKDVRTTSRYLKELEDRNIVVTKGIRGRAGGTIIMFNTELVRFETSDKAFINSDKPVTIDDIVEKRKPKKEDEPKNKKPKRNRRTKQQMIEDKLLQTELQRKNDNLNDKIVSLGGTPTWEWFQETEDPIGNYRTYLLTRLYNRYAVLFTDHHNAKVEVTGEGTKVPMVSSDYDVLPERFFGTSRWQQFEKFRKFCEENGIDPAVYLSAQFNRSVFDGARKNSKKILPFINALMSDASFEVFKQYCEYKKNYSYTFATYFQITGEFTNDFVVRAIREAYESAESGIGLVQYRHSISDFFEGVGAGPREEALLYFYDLTAENLRQQGVSFKTRETVKKYILTQALIQTQGEAALPDYYILGSEITRVILASIDLLTEDRGHRRKLKERALGMLLRPRASAQEQEKLGAQLYYELNALYETPKVLGLIMQRKGLTLSLADLNRAFKEYGKDKIPVDDYSMMDIDKIVEFVEQSGQVQEEVEIDYKEITTTGEWVLEGEVSEGDGIEESLQNYLNTV